MSQDTAQVSVRILGKEYQVSCPMEQRAALLDSAELLNQHMRDIRDSGKVVGLDRIAVMAALNLAHELLGARGKGQELNDDVGVRLKILRERVETALQDGQQMDL